MRSFPIAHHIGRMFALFALVGCGSTTAPPPVVVPPGPPPVTAATHPAGTLSTKITGFRGRPFGVNVSSAGLVYATQQDDNSIASFRLADATAGPMIGVGADPGDIVFSRGGSTAYVSAFYGGTVHLIDVAGSRQLIAIPIANNAYRLALSLDESTLFVSSTDGRVFAVNLSTRSVSGSVQLVGAIQGLALSHSG